MVNRAGCRSCTPPTWRPAARAGLASRADATMLIAQLGHIAVTGCERWLASTTEAERADNAAWVGEFIDDPVTVDAVDAILDAL